MKLVVMSDSHGDMETVRAVSALSADAIFHCGDSELSFNDPLLHKMYCVRGNCDWDSDYPSSVVIEVKGKIVLVVHGHEHDVKHSLLPLYYAALEHGADIVLFGHSHLYGAEMKEGILFVNPGSTMQPRGGKQATYAVIEWDEMVRVTFKNRMHDTVDFVEMNNFEK
ncbi:metallophosphoesterase [Sporosarcina limicola]|uniref:Phosphoesterase n=1 Tax=Sporosarcina limicola TaxID=34101 RepID=A0A927MNK5_9BACL|nr:metallophosphoesterase [Sporosarcina limicola]MBE1554486.1 putative phosphoesterase [Sporosarcina limicola]